MVGLLNLGSLLLGLLAWMLPIIGSRKPNDQSMVYVTLSFASVSLAILFQLMFQHHYAKIEDLSAIMDTIGFSVVSSWTLVIVATLFNALVMYRYISYVRNRPDHLEKLNLGILFLAMLPFVLWVIGYFLIIKISMQSVLFGLGFLWMVIAAAYRRRSSRFISTGLLAVLTLAVLIAGLKETSGSEGFHYTLASVFFIYYLILNLINAYHSKELLKP